MSATCVTGLFDISRVVGWLTGERLWITCEELGWRSATVTCLGSWFAVLILGVARLALWMLWISFVTFVKLAWIWVGTASTCSSSVWAASSVTFLAGAASIAGSVASICGGIMWSAVVSASGFATKTISWVSHDALSTLRVTSPAWAACSGIILVTAVPWVITDIGTSGTCMSILIGDRNMAPTTVYSSDLAVIANPGNVQAQAVWAGLVLLTFVNEFVLRLSQLQEGTKCN